MIDRAYEKWDDYENGRLLEEFSQNDSISEIAQAHQRSENAIIRQLKKLGIQPFSNSSETLGTEESAVDFEINYAPIIDVQEAFTRFAFVYGIVNKRKQIYFGFSDDVWKRIAQHNDDKGARATRNAGPWYPFCIQCTASSEDARVLEKKIHTQLEDYTRIYEKSLKQVLAQIGVSAHIDEFEFVSHKNWQG